MQVNFQTIVQRILPWRVMDRGHRASDDRFVSVVAEGHYVFLLMPFPLFERLALTLDIKARVIRIRDQFLDVIALIPDRIIIVLTCILARDTIHNISFACLKISIVIRPMITSRTYHACASNMLKVNH